MSLRRESPGSRVKKERESRDGDDTEDGPCEGVRDGGTTDESQSPLSTHVTQERKRDGQS